MDEHLSFNEFQVVDVKRNILTLEHKDKEVNIYVEETRISECGKEVIGYNENGK